MKTLKRFWLFSIIAFILHTPSEAGEKVNHKPSNPNEATGIPMSTLSNINRVSAWYSANGEQERIPYSGNSGLRYPRFTGTAIYSAGLIWGGIFSDGFTPVLRVNGQSYNNGTKPGRIIGIRTGTAEDPAAADVRIWRIRRDYSTADLRWDAAEIFQIDTSAVTQTHIDSIRSQYARDWQEWPWHKGAPFYDLDSNGIKDPTEEPGLADADQVVWYVCNDIGVTQPWTCPTSGIEQQTTIWAYNRPGSLGNVIFKRFRLHYKGLAAIPPTAHIDSMYIAQWSDPDLGTYTDDLVGCDTALNLGYCYNSGPVDNLYAQYGLPPPAAGYALLQGPMVQTGNPLDTAVFNFRKIAGARNLDLSAFIFFAAGLPIYSDPPFTYTGAVMWYQMLRGLPPRPSGPPDPSPIQDHLCNESTFMFSGDRVSMAGWLDGNIPGHVSCQSNTIADPGDRRLVMSTGPFTLAVGDSQEIIVANVLGLGSDYLNSTNVMRAHAQATKRFLDSLSGIITAVFPGVTPPSSFLLHQNYPNPFNPNTVITYELPATAQVSLKVYDVLGREVATLVSDRQSAGRYEVKWDASGLPSGVYFYRLSAGTFVHVKKMLLMK